MAELTRGLRRLLATTHTESDADLLGRFVADRDESAFAALVSRHGPMVLAVCRRVLRHRHDAEDAFQATFLVLARRAKAVKPQSLLGNWLHGVAYRTALSARRQAYARRAREAKAPVRVEDAPLDEGGSHELREVLDRELAALPDVYRAAVVACDLEGLSRREAVARLGWSDGTLASRLARARTLLARRLSRYGLVVPVAGLTAVAGPVAVAAELAEQTFRLGLLVAAGEAVGIASVAALMEAAMGTMILTKLKALAATLVVGCAIAVTAVAGWRADAAGATDPPRTAADPTKTPEAPKRAVPNSDKERIAELERERELLLRQLAELKDRLEKVEADQRLNAEAQAADRERAALEAAARRLAAERAERDARKVPNGTPEPVPAAPGLPNPRPGAAGTPREPAPVPVTPPATVPRPTPPGDSKKNAPVPSPQPATGPAEAKALVKVYPVGDLAGDEKEGDALAKVLRAAVEPKSWGADAGVEYLPGRKVLVVRQTEKGHEEVAEVLKLLKAQPAPQPGNAPRR